MIRGLSLLAILFIVSGCGVRFSEVKPGTTALGGLEISTSQSWNRLYGATPFAREGTQVWTMDGPLLNQLIVIPGVSDGETVFKQKKDQDFFPVFRRNMLPNELSELFESSILKIMGEEGVMVSTDNLRPQRFGNHRGLLFDFEISTADFRNFSGFVGAVVNGDSLYALIYFGAQPHYGDYRRDAAMEIALSIRLDSSSL